MACLQSFDPLLGGLPVSKNSSGSLKEDCKDDKVRRQQETCGHGEGQNEADEPVYPANQRRMLVEQQGISSHRTFIATGERYEMVSFDLERYLADTSPELILLGLRLNLAGLWRAGLVGLS